MIGEDWVCMVLTFIKSSFLSSFSYKYYGGCRHETPTQSSWKAFCRYRLSKFSRMVQSRRDGETAREEGGCG